MSREVLLPFFRPMRPDIQLLPLDLIAHPHVHNPLGEICPFSICDRIWNRQDLDTRRAMFVASLGRHDNIAIGHDAEFECQPHRGFWIGVDEIDNVPPGSADERVVGLGIVGRERWNRNLEFHVSDAHILDL